MESAGLSTSWISELYGENFLTVYDVVLDIKKELQFVARTVIPIFQPMVKFPQLMPAESINLRDQYCELCWEAAKLLQQHGAIIKIEVLKGFHRWEGRLEITPNREVFDSIAAGMPAEFQKRRAPSGGD